MLDLPEEDKVWLTTLDGLIWSSSTDRFGHVHRFPLREQTPLLPEALERVCKLVKDHELPCVMRSGPYAHLSLTFYAHPPFPGGPVDRLIVLAEEHLGAPEGGGDEGWRERWRFMSKWSHTERNEELAELYGLPIPGPISHYCY
jgi:hypothetical protein